MVQARMRSLEALCRCSTYSRNTILNTRSAQFLEHYSNSADTSQVQFSLQTDFMELDSLVSVREQGGISPLVDQDEEPLAIEMLSTDGIAQLERVSNKHAQPVLLSRKFSEPRNVFLQGYQAARWINIFSKKPSICAFPFLYCRMTISMKQ